MLRRSSQATSFFRSIYGIPTHRRWSIWATLSRRSAGLLRCAVVVAELLHDPPLEFPLAIRRKLSSIADALGIPNMQIPSGAGHDARYLHYVCPTAMIFIPCK